MVPKNGRSVEARQLLPSGLVVFALGLPTPVFAGLGDHVRLGNAELIPQLILGTQYRSNVYLMEADEVGGMALQLQPSAQLKLDSPDVKLDSLAAYDFRKYFDPDLTNLDRFRDGSFKLGLGLLPKSLLGVDFSESLVSSSRESEGWYSGSNALISHLQNDLSAGLAFHPGVALEGGLGGHFLFDDYNVPEDLNASRNANYNSKVSFGPKATFKWRFFPRTAIVLDASMDWFSWKQNLVDIQAAQGQDASEYGSYLGIPDGWILSVGGGLRGRFTERLTLGLVLGYNDAVYDEQSVVDAATGSEPASDLDAVAEGFDADAEGIQKLLAAASVQYDMSETHKITLGYDRGLSDSYFTNYFVHDYVFLRYQVLLGTRFGVAGEGGYRLESFHGEVERTDHVVRTRAGLSYAANEWLAVGTVLTWDRRASADQIAEIEYDDVSVSLQGTFVY